MNRYYYKAKREIIILLCFLLISCSKEIKYNPIIPSDASVVITVNPSIIKNNLLWELLKNGKISNPENLINSAKALDSNLTALFVNADNAGISYDKPIYIFIKNNDPKTITGVSFFIKNEEAFLNYFSSFKKKDNNAYVTSLSSNSLIFYSDHTALYLSTSKDSMQLSTADLDQILNTSNSKLPIDPTSSPVTFTVDGNYISSLTGFTAFTDSSLFTGTIDFTNDLFKIEMDQQFRKPERFIIPNNNLPTYTLANSGNIDANFFFNPTTIYEQLSELRKNSLENMGITRELISEAFTGEVLFTAGNPVTVKEKYLTYELDDDFNTIEKWGIKEKKQGNFLLALGVKNKDVLKNLLSIGLKKHLIKQYNTGYKLSFTNTDIFLSPSDTHFIISTRDKISTHTIISKDKLPYKLSVRPSLADSLFTSYIKDPAHVALFNSVDSLSIQFEKPAPNLINYKIQIDLADYQAVQ